MRLTKRLLRSLRGLQWKLTLSYTLVTVGAILIIEIGLLVAEAILSAPPPQLPGYLAHALLAQSAAQVAPYLMRTPPGRECLADWLHEVSQEGQLRLGGAGQEVNISQVRTAFMAVVDAEGRVVAAVPDGRAAGGSLLQTQLSPLEAEVLRTAMHGPLDPARLWATEPDDKMVVAAPVFGEDRHPLGVLFLTYAMQPRGPRRLLGTILEILLPSAMVLTAFAGVMGTLFGFLTARWLTRRLRALAAAADAWGQGDFSTFIHAPGGDEIDRLGRQLNQMAEQLQNLLQAREELATLEERNRLARDLHDSVKQQVFAATMTLGAVEALWERDLAAARQKVVEALALSRQAQQELAGLIHELRPIALEGKGLATALREYAERWSRQTGIAAQVVVQGGGTLSLQVERACFRVAQEALANVARHSGANCVRVSLDNTGASVTLTVADNGCGFDLSAAEGRGMGLRSMRERIEALGGNLTVESVSGQGTSVTVRCAKRSK